MSNYLAIATVTAALEQLVRTAAQAVVHGSQVLTGRPDPNATPGHRIHLFLYQVLPNGAMRNNDLPARSPDGTVVKRPTVALDLHYLLAFYGSDTELEAQRMLGAVVRDLHAKPLLTRSMIQSVIKSQTFLTGSNLADAVEQIRFTPLPLSLEEMSKLWSVFFQAPYALSVAYQSTAVLIESEEPVQSALPVLKRGARDQGVDLLPGSFPCIESAYFGMPEDSIMQPRPPSLPTAQLGLAVIVTGRNLGGESVLLRFHHSKLGLTRELSVASADISAKELKVRLPRPGAGSSQTDWAPGVYTVTVVQKQSGATRERTSNALPIALSPLIGSIEPGTTIPRDTHGNVKIILTCLPQIRSAQQTVLLLAGREIVGQIDDDNPDKVIFDVKNAVVMTNELIRLRVDGIESTPIKRVDSPPPTHFEFDANQRVTIT
ncbi:MAG: DUF4255 domain-containing protein [Desulfuromonadaceae bacterium]